MKKLYFSASVAACFLCASAYAKPSISSQITTYINNPSIHPLSVTYEYDSFPTFAQTPPQTITVQPKSSIVLTSPIPADTTQDFAFQISNVTTTDGSGYEKNYGMEDCEFDYEYTYPAVGMITLPLVELNQENNYKTILCFTSFT